MTESKKTKGRDLKPGMTVDGALVVSVRPYLVPPSVLHPYYVERFPHGMPGRLVGTIPSNRGFTAFDDEEYSP